MSLICILIASSTILNVYSFNIKLDVLTSNFFENLEGDPLLLANEFDEESKLFIEKQVANYVNLITREEIGPVKQKRSLLDKIAQEFTGTYQLSGIKKSVSIPVKPPTDVVLFRQNSRWYAAALENSDLIIFQYGDKFEEKTRLPLSKAVKLATISLKNSTLIAVAKNDTLNDNFHEKSGVFRFDDDGLVKIQSLDVEYSSDVVMWRMHNEIYMSLAQFTTDNSHYEVKVPIYKWLGQHFDLVQTIKGSGVKNVVPFTIDHSNFLAIANFKDGTDTKTYSEIYKYDYHLDKYVLYQRILTRACMDVEFFSLSQNNRKKDHFLIVANSYEEDANKEINYETDSIMYKFVDGYFIPFQSFELVAVENWLSIEGPNGEFVLFASCRFDGLKSFQYDGWAFREIPQMVIEGEGIQSIHSTIFNSTPTIVVANRNHDNVNLYKLEFTHQNNLADIYNEMSTWCDQGLVKIESLLQGGASDDILGKAERADIEEMDKTPLDVEIEEVNSKIDTLNSMLRSFTADEIIFNGSTIIHDLKTPKINSFNTNQLLDNVLNIDEGFHLDEISLKSGQIHQFLSPKTINGHDSQTLVHRSDDLDLDQLIVHGNLVALDGIKIEGQLNGVTIDDQNILLSVGDQNLTLPLSLDSVKIEQMTAKSLNGIDLASLRIGESIDIDHIHTLRVKNLTIGGYINDVDVPALNKYALKISGNQELSAGYSFDVLEGRNLKVDGEISGRKLSDLIPIDEGEYTIDQAMIFSNNLTVDDLIIKEILNGIQVQDILIKDSSEEQEISGEKVFDDLIIYHAIYLQGNIKSDELEKMNPMVTIDQDVVLEGNKTITGNVQVEDLLKVTNIATLDGDHSLIKLQAKGLKLTDRDIQPRLCFLQQLNVDEIFVDTINDQDPSSFVVIGGDDTQIIQGSKVFLGDLMTTGPTNAFKINDVNVEELENKVMKVDGDQTITGKHHIKEVIVNQVTSNDTRFGNQVWGDLIAINTSKTITIDTDLKANTIKTESIDIRGLINGLDFNTIVEDTVAKDVNTTIGGFKHFKKLTVDDLIVQNGVTDRIQVDTNDVIIESPLKINSIQVENLYFDNKINGVDRDSFGKYDVDQDGRRIVNGNQTFDTIRIYGIAYIDSNKINNVDIDDLVENTVKIDEPFEFEMATFETEIVSTNQVLLQGHVENLDFDNLVLSESNSEGIIVDEKLFNNVTINGSVHIEGFVNTINLTDFCQFAMGQIDEKNLTLHGDVFFAKGPNVKQINGVDVATIWREAWFKDKATTMVGYVEFDNLTFKDNIEVKGFVDNVSLKLLSENYFSKSKDQNITAVFNFQNELIFDHILVPEMTVSGVINGINLDKFVRTALLNDYDQVFETILYLENCTVTNISGNYLINDVNLDQDVMRYDKINMVTGAKFFDNLDVNLLKVEKNIKIQDVDVLDWFKLAVLKNSTFNITGNKSFRDLVFANGFQLDGTLNGNKFDEDTIMVKDKPQDITGNKIITSGTLDPVTFKAIKLRGLLNNIDVSDLVKNQAYKNEDNAFKSSLNLYNNITTTNLIINRSYQGINMTELITNVKNLGALNNLLDQYNELLNMSYKLKESIKAQAYFLHHYKIIQTIPRVTNTQKIFLPDGATNLGSLVTDGSGSKMDLYSWQDQEELFINDVSIKFGKRPLRYIDQVMMGRYLYMEHDGNGRFVHMGSSDDTVTISTNTTRSTTSFLAPSTNEICTLFTYFECAPRIFCENEGIRFVQNLGSSPASKTTAITINGRLYLMVINDPINGIESRVDLWVWNEKNGYEIQQSLFEAQPKSMATVYHHGFAYLAIASGHLQNAMYSGRVELRRFDEKSGLFVPLQSLKLDAPVQVEFSVLPSDELVLYVLTDNPTEPLLVYRYEGIAGFRLAVMGATLPRILYMNQFLGAAGKHLIVAQSYDEILIIKAIFKGERVTD